MTIIGIPVYNDKENLKTMIGSLFFSTDAIEKIILIESESTDGSAELCDELAKQHSEIEVIHEKRGKPADKWDKLFERAKENKEDLFLTHTDVIFTKIYNRDWLGEFKEVAKSPICGLISCFDGGKISDKNFINGFCWFGTWCLYIPYRTIEKIGGFDKNISAGWGDDIEYTYHVAQTGLHLIQANFYWVFHHPNYEKAHEHEHRSDIKKLQKEAFTYMRKKWKVGEFAE